MQKPFAITLDPGSSLANKTGSWRSERPVYVDRLPPCNAQCPAGENIQGWLYHAESGDYEAAWRHLTADNPFPAIMGRVCYHTCESACNRAQLDSAVGINSVERFLGDEALRRGWRFDRPDVESGKHVLVVGAGPSGMSAAYHLRRLGHRVTVKEAGPLMGGMMRFGIPKYRLPRDVLDGEMQRLLDMGVVVELNAKVQSLEETLRRGDFDGAFLAVGAHLAKRAYIPAVDSARILDAVSVLRSMEGAKAAEQPMLGRRVVVYGGGNTAIDMARTAKRLGATEAIIVYRRTREKMPAHDFEVQEALEEGVMVKWLSTIKRADLGALTIEKMTLDDRARRCPPASSRPWKRTPLCWPSARKWTCRCSTACPAWWWSDGVVQVDPATMMTGRPGIFAGGDMVPGRAQCDGGRGPRQEGRAPHRRLAARHATWSPAPKHEVGELREASTPGTTPTRRRPCARNSTSSAAQSSFDEVQGGLTEDNALFEARRCLSPAATASSATTATACAPTTP
jgi:thioredoxin reductase